MRYESQSPPVTIESLQVKERSYKRALDVVDTTIQENGRNLFLVPLKNALVSEGTPLADKIIGIGDYREYVVYLYSEVKKPDLETKIVDVTSQRSNLADEKASELQRLLEGGYISLTDYTTALNPLREHMSSEKSLVRIPSTETDSNYDQLRQLFEDRLKGVRFRGYTAIAMEELLSALDPQSAYPSQALRLAIYKKPKKDGTRPTLAAVINSARKIAGRVGVEVVTKRAASNSSYWLRLEGDEIIGGNENKAKTKTKEQVTIEKMPLRGVQKDIVAGLVGYDSRTKARAKEEWAADAYPGLEMDNALNRLAGYLPAIKSFIKEYGLYIHFERTSNGTIFYMNENPIPDPKPKQMRKGRSVKLESRSQSSRTADDSEHEKSRQGIEDKIRELTSGSVRGSLIDD